MLEGKVAVVTGASRGIGRAIALTFAREGADVGLIARDKGRLDQVGTEVQAMGRKALALVADVAKEADVERMARTALDTFGKVDILVNNVGIIRRDTPVWATTVEQWDELIGVNLRAPFLCARAFLPSMIERSTGFIINIGSRATRHADGEDGAYVTSKWGLLGYTASLARSVRPYQIRVNAINPGWVDTDIARGHPDYGRGQDMSTPEEIARVALFLVTAGPPDMTGQAIDVFAHP